MSASTAILYYVHDPMCSWCWAYRPVLLKLRAGLPDAITWQNVLGGLAPDNTQPMPQQTRDMVQAHWRQIQATTNTRFNFDFWTKCQPRRDTYKACRAVIAAAYQQAEEPMIEAIQTAYYLRAMNPSEPEVLTDLAAELGLDRRRFSQDLQAPRTDAELRCQLALRDSLQVRSFPSMVLQHHSDLAVIRHDYQDYRATLKQIETYLASTPVR